MSPVNPYIPLAVQPPQVQDPLTAMGRVTQLQNEQTVLANNRLSLQQNQKEVSDRQKIEQIFREERDPENAIGRVSKEVDPLTGMQMASQWQKQKQDQADWMTTHSNASLDLLRKQYSMLSDDASAALDQPDADSMVGSYRTLFTKASKAGVPRQDETGKTVLPDIDAFQQLATQNPENARTLLQDMYAHGKTSKELADAEIAKRNLSEGTAKDQSAWLDVMERRGRAVTDDASLATFRKDMAATAPAAVVSQIPTSYDTQTWQRFMQSTAPGKATGDDFQRLVSKKEDELGRPMTTAEELALRKEYQTTPLSGMNALYNDIDPKSISGSIERGTAPPDISQYGRPVAAAIASELSKDGYDLAKAQLEWAGAKRFMATANNDRQLKMRQGIDNAYHSLDVIDAAAKAWGGGRFPALNSAMLKGSAAGLITGTVHATIPLFDKATGNITPTTKDWTASEIARILTAQIADLTSELGTVYMGGNSPTDTALGLAAHNLGGGDWSARDMFTMTALARTNLAYRNNAIANVAAVGVGGGSNSYLPQGGREGGPGPGPAPPPATYGQRTLPNGSVIFYPVVGQ